ncbi:efflux RND transporter periplasmic adaptor subunit [Rhodohalobacter sp.]|uniref:efflux RND transporter periplasmic adaptor subunit n=1 Tax=Rhodohalobacter sp. TaxID=1974210 RepID=UPI002ACD2771|nr:efflux RND transporter periplasmic adaptor subunit [Rhodohalobacter sp.]MDZ7755772.1 efflux RND transporter periplasmic adaptor subunit [Rhodohalobacter sp.]
MNITKTQILTYTAILFTGLILGWLIFGGSNDHVDHEQLTEAEMDQHVTDEHTDEDGEIIYTCSMHPSVRQNEPGNCPICGMELIPAGSQNAEASEDDYSMVMTASAASLADIQTAPVERRAPEKVLDLPGRIQVDERRLTNVTTHFSGRIRDLKIDFTGAPIRKDEVMATIYSPELIAAQRELLEAARQKERNPRLYESARQKFRLWEFTEEQINEIEERGSVQNELEILSPANGFVMSRNVAEEQHVAEGTVIFEVANLDRVWIVLEAYEEDLEWISVGDTFDFHTRANPGQNLEATVSFIDPVVDSRSRTVRVRADLNNSDDQLKPDMLVRAQLNSRMQDEKLLVPASSVLWTGPRSLVYVQDTSADVPRFEVREVELGPKTGDYYVIESGLEEGEQVVFHGNFRIDSEFQLADKFSMMNREPGSGARTGHDHGGMEMDDQEMEQDTDDHSGHEQEEEGHESHSEVLMEEDLEALVPNYLELREALANDDFEMARQYMDLFSEEDFSSIDELREEFKVISEMLVTRVEEEGYDGELYKQYCPMYDGGSNWISDSKEIENPYYGDEMLKCGETVKTL